MRMAARVPCPLPTSEITALPFKALWVLWNVRMIEHGPP